MGIKLKLCNPKACKLEHSLFHSACLCLTGLEQRDGRVLNQLRLRGKTESTAIDMTSGPILGQLVAFALPLMLGNVFQMLYNTVDSVIVGNFVSKQALAAIGSTTMIVNMLVFFFNGFSTGAMVTIGQYYGAQKLDKLHRAVETTMPRLLS